MDLNSEQVTEFLNLCDRVEVLGELVHDSDHKLDEECFDHLMERYYPSLERFFHEVKGDAQVTGINVAFDEDSATFTTMHADGTERHFSFDAVDIFDE